ncbi:hypothetical protein D3C77_596360 [compost metagenome]
MLGKLDGKGADAAGPGLDEHLLACFHLADLDQSLPGGQSDERDRRGLLHGKAGRL